MEGAWSDPSVGLFRLRGQNRLAGRENASGTLNRISFASLRTFLFWLSSSAGLR